MLNLTTNPRGPRARKGGLELDDEGGDEVVETLSYLGQTKQSTQTVVYLDCPRCNRRWARHRYKDRNEVQIELTAAGQRAAEKAALKDGRRKRAPKKTYELRYTCCSCGRRRRFGLVEEETKS